MRRGSTGCAAMLKSLQLGEEEAAGDSFCGMELTADGSDRTRLEACWRSLLLRQQRSTVCLRSGSSALAAQAKRERGKSASCLWQGGSSCGGRSSTTSVRLVLQLLYLRMCGLRRRRYISTSQRTVDSWFASAFERPLSLRSQRARGQDTPPERGAWRENGSFSLLKGELHSLTTAREALDWARSPPERKLRLGD